MAVSCVSTATNEDFMKTLRRTMTLAALFFLGLGGLIAQAASGGMTVAKDSRCTVCGMFVAKYPNWVVQATLTDGEVLYFDGVKDAMVFYFAPQKYGAKQGATVAKMMVTDYYSLAPLEAKAALFVIGSDVTGPMGHEFIPFASREAAEAFRNDHRGTEVLDFTAITPALVESMRSGSRMK